MPTYDYECDGCGHKFELFQSITDSVKRKCPECRKQKLRRLFGTGAAIMFKGSGFYQTDYRSESYKSAAAKDASAAKPAESGSGNGEAAKGDSGKSSGASDGAKSTTKSDKPKKKAAD
jgi:putative FmdB family regulatory protein